MEHSLISLLTPNTSDEQKLLADSTVVESNSIREQFANILSNAQSQLRIDGKERISEAEKRKTQEALGLKTLPDQLEDDLIVGIMPPIQEVVEDIPPVQESIVAAVIFDKHLLPPTKLDDVKVPDLKLEPISRLFPEDTINATDDVTQLLEVEYQELTPLELSNEADIIAAPILESQQALTAEKIIPDVAAPAPVAAMPPIRTITHPAPKQPLLEDVRYNFSTQQGASISSDMPDAELLLASRPVIATTSMQQDLLSTDMTDSQETPDFLTVDNKASNLNVRNSGEQPLRLLRPTPEMYNMTPPEQVAVRISQAISEGHNKITLQLYPEELGRIDVRLDIDRDNNTLVRVIAESRETYDVLRADKSNLERLLHESGLNTNNDGLQFSYQGNKEGDGNNDAASGQQAADHGTESEILTDEQQLDNLQLIATTGLNIKV